MHMADNDHPKATAQKQAVQESLDVVTIQNTSMSVPAPNSAVNKSMPHQIVVALPLRHDGKIWIGTVTFTASKSIEVEVEHKYNPKVIPVPDLVRHIMVNGLIILHV